MSGIASILGYGAYLPRYRIPAAEIARVYGRNPKTTPIKEKTVPGLDEDSLTLAYEAALNALRRAAVDPSEIEAVFVGSESPPYAVKPTATVIAEALGITPRLYAVDMEFACRAGTTALLNAVGLVHAGLAKYGMAIGTDTAQGRPGDALEYTAAAGAAAYIVSPPRRDAVATIEAAYSYVTDTPDFWRREGQRFPRHGSRFTGEPAYFAHIMGAARGLMEETGLRPSDFRYVVFHQPNVKFPTRVAKRLGFTREQYERGLLSGIIGNTYAAASPIGLVNVLDAAAPGDRILLVSFGSGAGSDAISLVVEDGILDRRGRAPLLSSYIERRKVIDYALYLRYRDFICR